MRGMTSRERIRAAMRREATDHLPLCFEGICHGAPRHISEAIPDPFERARYYLDRGIDTAVTCSPPAISERGFTTRQWMERPAGERYPVLHREYLTPAGALRQTVRKTDDYPDEISLFSDHNVPAGRSLRYLVESEGDLEPLEWILRPTDGDELEAYREKARQARGFCDRHGVLLAAYIQGVGDPLIWMGGVEGTLLAAVDHPSFLERLVEIVARWNRRVLEIALDAGCDHVVRRGWYESTDFWSPAFYRRFLLGPLKAEAAMTREAGATLAYVMNTGVMPLLRCLREAGIDMLSNIDPLGPGTDLGEMKRIIGGEVALCGGVNNSHILEMGTGEEVREAVAEAARLLGPGGGYVMAPGDALGYVGVTETVRRNYEVMINAWRAIRGEGEGAT